jgi:RND family efflux transporter MFP subunit
VSSHPVPRVEYAAALVIATTWSLVAAAGCSGSKPPENATPDPVSVTTAAARIDTLVDRLTASGTVVVSRAADMVVIAPEAATIVELPKQEGDRVEAGDLLVRFEIVALTQALDIATMAVTQAGTRVDAAKAELAKLSELDAKGMVPRGQVDAARNTLLDAQAAHNRANEELASAKARQAHGEVRARFAGVVVKRWHVDGDAVIAAETDPVIRVVDQTRLQVAVPISKADLVRIVPGLPVMVSALGAPPEPATIALMPTVDAEGRTAELRLGFVGKTALTLDSVVDVEMIVDQRPDVLSIPRKAVQRDEEASVSYVLVAGADNIAHRKVVTVGFGTRDQIQILTGIAAGDRVILNGFDLLSDGSAITIER